MRTQKAQIRLELPAFQEEKRINKPAVMSEASDLDNGSTARRIANALGITERTARWPNRPAGHRQSATSQPSSSGGITPGQATPDHDRGRLC
jgi:hypothetical protein